jgi:hypothetical protein
LAPYSTCGNTGPRSRAVWPASFRLQGLVTLLTVSSPRILAGLVSFRQRSWDLPFEAFPLARVSACSHGDVPTCRSLFGCLSWRTKSRRKGLPRRLLGFDPGASPLPRNGQEPVVGRMLPWASCPSRGCSPVALNWPSPALLSRAWLGNWCLLPPTPQSFNRPRTRLFHEGRAAPSRVLTPSASLPLGPFGVPGYAFTLQPLRHCCR